MFMRNRFIQIALTILKINKFFVYPDSNVKYPANMQSIIGLHEISKCVFRCVLYLDVDSVFSVVFTLCKKICFIYGYHRPKCTLKMYE